MENASIRGTIVGFAFAFLYWILAITIMPDSVVGVNTIGNIKAYFIFLVIFFTATFLSIAVQRKLKFLNSNRAIVLSILVWVVGILACIFIVENNVIIGGGTGFFLQIMLMLVSCMLFVAIYTKAANVLIFNRSLLGGLTALIALVWYYNVATNNPFVVISNDAMGYGTWYNVHHSSAYIDSIYAVYNHAPFQGGLTDQYGHYALFFYIPLLIFGGTVNTIAKMLGIVAAFSAAVFFICFFRTIKNDVLIIIFGTLMIGAGMYPTCLNIYWQTYPHRFLAPAITIGWIMYVCDKELTIFHHIFGTFLMLICFLWNTDIGILCIGCYILFLGVKAIRGCKEQNIGMIIVKIMVMAIITIVVVVLSALAIVSLYNILCGGDAITLNKYLTLDNTGYVKSLENPIDFWNYAYSLKLIFLLTSFVLSTTYLITKIGEEKYELSIFLMTNSLIGFGWLTYYIDHSAAGCDMISIFVFICFLGLIELIDGEKLLTEVRFLHDTVINNVKYGTIIVSMLLIMCELQKYGENLYLANDKNDSGAYNYGGVVDIANAVRDYIEDDTIGVGIGTSAIFLELGLDKKSYLFDAGDINDVWNGKPVFLCLDEYEDYIPEDYEMTHELIINNLTYGLYEKE